MTFDELAPFIQKLLGAPNEATARRYMGSIGIGASSDSVVEGTTNLFFTVERAQDAIATLLVAGANITLTYNDVGDTLTIASTGGGGGGGGITRGTYAARPGSPANGDLHFCTDAPCWLVYDTASTSWKVFFRGSQVTPPTFASFTQTNWGTTANTALGPFTVIQTQKATAYALRVLDIAAPATPYRVETTILIGQQNMGSWLYGVGFRQSSDGKMALGMVDRTGGGNVFKSVKMNSATSTSANYSTQPISLAYDAIRIRFRDDGVNRYIDIYDGGAWLNYHSVGRTDFMTGDRICMAFNNESGIATYFAILDWTVS